jgi:hypothetical protein
MTFLKRVLREVDYPNQSARFRWRVLALVHGIWACCIELILGVKKQTSSRLKLLKVCFLMFTFNGCGRVRKSNKGDSCSHLPS